MHGPYPLEIDIFRQILGLLLDQIWYIYTNYYTLTFIVQIKFFEYWGYLSTIDTSIFTLHKIIAYYKLCNYKSNTGTAEQNKI